MNNNHGIWIEVGEETKLLFNSVILKATQEAELHETIWMKHALFPLILLIARKSWKSKFL